MLSLFRKLFGKRKANKFMPPESLSSEVMKDVMREVDFLKENHRVDVRELSEGESPTTPKRADEDSTT
ncbi:MAG: hypothetical protein R3D71_07370 [Rickettsiales bacterium]